MATTATSGSHHHGPWHRRYRLEIALALIIALILGAWAWDVKWKEQPPPQAAASAASAAVSGKAPASAIFPPAPVAAASATTTTASGKVVATTTVAVASQPKAPASKPATAKKQEKKDVKLVTATPSVVKAPKMVAAPATAYLPMARNGEIENPRVLAERIRDSLRRNPSGTSRVKGANIDPHGFLAAVKKAGGTVDGVHALPAYLESLIGREMPEGVLTMSRVVYTRDTKGVEKFTLDVMKGYPRRAHKGERGWYDANTGKLILAGDCSNSPLAPIGLPPPPPAPAIHRPAPVQQPPQQVMPLGRIPKLVCVTCPEKKKEQ